VTAPRALAAAIVVECRKALAQWLYRGVLIVCAVAPIVFVIALAGQGAVPSDTLFGRLVFDSGLAIPLVVLGFAGTWGLPVIAAVAGGDLFASEDRHRAWAVTLTRSRSRSEVFAAKTLVACGFLTCALLVLAVSAGLAGAVWTGTQPLIDLSGAELAPAAAAARIALAWASVVPPCLAITAAALVTSIATRSSVAGVGVPIFAALVLQLAALVDVPARWRLLLPVTALEGWHGLLAQPAFYRPLVWGAVVNLGCAGVLIAWGRRLFLGRDIT
jgi:ABC-2 type transport system permease protein